MGTKELVHKRVSQVVPRNKWIASLSNGETVFDDIDDCGLSAWERLSNYVKANNLSITCLRAQMGSSTISLPPNQEGYIQYKKASSFVGSGTTLSLCIGFVQGTRCKIYEIGNDKSSRTVVIDDPGEPKTIYRMDKRV